MLKNLIRKVYPSRITLAIMVGIIIYAVAVVAFGITPEIKAKEKISELAGENVVVVGKIKGDPEFSENSGSVKLEKIKINDEEMRGMIYVAVTTEERLERGDVLMISGKMTEGFGTFVGAIYHGTVKDFYRPETGRTMINLRNKFSENVKRVINREREAGLGLGYLLGMRNELDDEVVEMLALVGLTHIVVASGTHLGLIIDFLKKRFGKISRFAGVFFSLVFIFLFAELIGWTPSITRAAIVTGVTLVGWYSGKTVEGWRVILFAMAITLAMNPMNLVDLGWLLSFASFIGIMILAPILKTFFYGKINPWEKAEVKKKKGPGKIAEMIIASVAANLMCAPILIYFFGSISLISVIANVLILPTIPMAIGLTFLSGVVGFLPEFLLFDWIKVLVSNVTKLLLDCHLVIIEFFSRQNSFLVSVEKGDARIFLLYFIILTPFLVAIVKDSIRKRRLTREINAHPEKYILVA